MRVSWEGREAQTTEGEENARGPEGGGELGLTGHLPLPSSRFRLCLSLALSTYPNPLDALPPYCLVSLANSPGFTMQFWHTALRLCLLASAVLHSGAEASWGYTDATVSVQTKGAGVGTGLKEQYDYDAN